uniref:DUF7026 domain-containing protein n=1 Tax=Kalanchoe fedtschenkoi TaxID=63787 RepID=A0A7N0TP01_KALFE
MATRAHLHILKSLPLLPPHLTRPQPTRRAAVTCCSGSLSDAELSLQLATEVVRIRHKKRQREEAVAQSRAILFAEMSRYLGFPEGEMKRRWRSMVEIDKWVVVEGFLSEWGENFRPLSGRSVKQMVEEHLEEFESSDSEPGEQRSSASSSSSIFLGLKKMMGFD